MDGNHLGSVLWADASMQANLRPVGAEDSAWVVDATYKVNSLDLPLYLCVAPDANMKVQVIGAGFFLNETKEQWTQIIER